jgi:hypothetical protein
MDHQELERLLLQELSQTELTRVSFVFWAVNLFKGMWEKVLVWFVNFSNWLEARSQQ